MLPRGGGGETNLDRQTDRRLHNLQNRRHILVRPRLGDCQDMCHTLVLHSKGTWHISLAITQAWPDQDMSFGFAGYVDVCLSV